MDKLYWAVEYARVLFALVFILYLWPSVVFKKHLKKKTSRTYKFVFCTVVQQIVINTTVLGLGLVGLLKPWLFNILFFGSFLFFLFKDVKIEKSTLLKFKYLISGTYGPKTLLSDFFKFVKKNLSKVRKSFLNYMKGHWFEYGILLLLVIFGCIYFSMNAFQENSYGFGDLYTHHSWIYNLSQGVIFSGGVYPASMHCLIAVEHFSLGLTIYNALLFTGPIFTAVIIVSLYLLFRELFRWKWTPMILVTMILTIDVGCMLSVSSFSRWQWTMPQEYGYPAMFLCLAYVIRFFKNGATYKRTKKPMFLKDDDLFLFVFCIAAAIAAHFYSIIMAFMLCIPGAIILIRRFFSKKFLGFIIACFAGLFIAMGPMLGALAEGYQFQGSIRWALSLILSEEQYNAIYGDYAYRKQQSTEENWKRQEEEASKIEQELEDKYQKYQDMDFESETVSELDKVSYLPGNGGSVGTVATLMSSEGLVRFLAETEVVNTAQETKDVINKKLNTIYNSAYKTMNGETRANVIIIMSFAVLAAWLIIRIVLFILGKVKKDFTLKGHYFDGYVVVVIASFIFTVSYALRALGLPELLEQYRVGAVAQIMCLAVLVVPLDILGVFVFDRFKKSIRMTIAAALVIGVYVGAKITGNFHGYLMIELTRYNSAVTVSTSIFEKFGKEANNFTLISSTDELYPLLGYGYHEELITFINNSEYVSYTIPTEYLFLMVEKNPIARAQHHLANGPEWIAENKYQHFYGDTCSVYPDINHKTISEDYANIYFGRFPESSTVYNSGWQRTLLNSKAYVWCQKFNAMYPNELHTYYEDDDIIVYYLQQNPRNLYELATMDPSVMVPPESYNDPIWPKTYKERMITPKSGSTDDLTDEDQKDEQD